MFIIIVQVIQSLTNLWWKFLLSSKNPPSSSWLYTAIDTGLFAIIGLYFELYQLLAFELFFMFVAIGLFSKKLHKLHYITIGIIVGAIYLLNTINPVTTLELLVVLFYTSRTSSLRICASLQRSSDYRCRTNYLSDICSPRDSELKVFKNGKESLIFFDTPPAPEAS